METDGSGKKRCYPIQDYTLKELTGIYNVSRYRLLQKLIPLQKKIGERKRNYYEKAQVEKIFELVALPSDVEIIK